MPTGSAKQAKSYIARADLWRCMHLYPPFRMKPSIRSGQQVRRFPKCCRAEQDQGRSMPTNFERARMMLDQMCPLLDSGGQAQPLVKAQLDALADAYPQIWNPVAAPIDYSQPACQAAYVYQYMVANANLIYNALRDATATSKAIFSRDQVKIACVGGGPGTEMIGIFKYLERRTPGMPNLLATVLDHHPTWSSVWPVTLSTRPQGVGASIGFAPMNLSAPAKWHAFDFAQADMITFSYCLSEVWRFNGDGRISKCIASILGAAKAGALIVYSDNGGPNFDPNMERDFAGRPDLIQVHRHNYTHMLIGNDEEKSVVGDYTNWLGKFPKLRGNATVATFVKQ